MKLIGDMVNILNEFIPGHIGKYKDDFEPRAFGDNFTKWGTSIVLIESGGWRGDREKQYLRKINYIAILSALNSIATSSFQKQDLSVYESIPNNEELMMDIILRNLKMNKDGNEYTVDIGINFEEINTNEAKNFYLEAEIEDIGDLSVFSGYDEFDFSNYSVFPGKTKPEPFNSIDELSEINLAQLFTDGYTNVRLNNNNFHDDYPKFPFNIILNNADTPSDKIKVEGSANFILRKSGETKFAVVNGFVIDIANTASWNGNSIVIKK
jgi:hypothetical protein